MPVERFQGGDGETVKALAEDAKVKPRDLNKALLSAQSPLLRGLLSARDLDVESDKQREDQAD